jgi:hypothetical protein
MGEMTEVEMMQGDGEAENENIQKDMSNETWLISSKRFARSRRRPERERQRIQPSHAVHTMEGVRRWYCGALVVRTGGGREVGLRNVWISYVKSVCGFSFSKLTM